MSCQNPLDFAVLADYWAGALLPAEEEPLEEHLFECEPCGALLRDCVALAESIRALTREGSLLMVVSDTLLKRLAADGARVREYAPPAGGSVACTVTADDDFLIGRLMTDLREARRVDLCICNENGVEQLRLADVPFNSEAGSVAFQQSITYAKAAPSETMIARLLGFDDAGAERLLGEYTFNHTRTLPGPGTR